MATTHSTAARNAITNTVTALFDIGSTAAGAQWVIVTSGDVEVSTNISSSATSFGGSANGIATAVDIDDDTSATGGIAAKYELQNRDALAVVFGSVTASGGGGDITLSTVTIPAAGTVELTLFTYTAPP